jgi:hypothetical protein
MKCKIKIMYTPSDYPPFFPLLVPEPVPLKSLSRFFGSFEPILDLILTQI